MRQRNWLALAMAAASIGFTLPSVWAASHPNIALIISDDQAWTDYRFMGSPVGISDRTPLLRTRTHLHRIEEN